MLAVTRFARRAPTFGQRAARQTNWYDCGPFVAADFVSLLQSDVPSTRSQRDMGEWRLTMARHMRTLEVWKRDGRPQALTKEQLARSVVL